MYLPKLKALPVGIAKIIRMVIAHFTKYGKAGVPNGFVDDQRPGKGRTPCRPHSRSIRDCPSPVAIRLPKALNAMRKFNPLTAFPEPKTAAKKSLATVTPEPSIWALLAAAC